MNSKSDKYYDKLIKKRIGEAIREFSPEDEKLDTETFQLWVKKAEERKWGNRVRGIVRKFFFCDGVLRLMSVSCKMKQKHRNGFASPSIEKRKKSCQRQLF